MTWGLQQTDYASMPVPELNPFNTALKSGLSTYQNMVNAKYAPLKAKAQAASQLAYANLMGPQFIAKAMGNKDILANLTDDEKRKALGLIYQAGTGQSAANQILNPTQNPAQPSTESNEEPGALQNLINWLTGKQGPSNKMTPETAPQVGQGSSDMSMQNYLQNNPQARDELSQTGQTVVTQPNIPAQPVVSPSSQKTGKPTWAETTAAHEGTIEEGKTAGKHRADDIQKFGDEYEAAITVEVPLKQLIDTANSPVFKNMRSKIPFFQDKQLSYLAKQGTPEEQKAIGNFITSSQEIVRDTVNSFKGQRMKGELTIAQNMKVSDNDTWNVMMGKLEAAMLYKEMHKQRASIAPKYMKAFHIDKQAALEMADKDIDGNKIRSNIDRMINPVPTDADIKFMAQKYKRSEDEIKNELRTRGILK